MLPPGKNDLFVEKQPFPLDITPDLLQKIQGTRHGVLPKKGGRVRKRNGVPHNFANIQIERGGYYFEVKPFSSEKFAALFVPKGWHHWLLGKSDWAVGFGSSRF